MSNVDYVRFFDEGKAVIRRVEAEWGGNETDKVIEQDLMRLIKSKGGLTRGRGISDSTMHRFTNALPMIVPMCNTLEKYCNVHSHSSEQHKDLRQVSKVSQYQHIKCFVEWLDLTQQPPSLFKEGRLRKNNKSDLAQIVKSSSSPTTFGGNQVVVDGGHLLHAAHDWTKGEKHLDFSIKPREQYLI